MKDDPRKHDPSLRDLASHWWYGHQHGAHSHATWRALEACQAETPIDDSPISGCVGKVWAIR